jgi:hypothetical protein
MPDLQARDEGGKGTVKFGSTLGRQAGEPGLSPRLAEALAGIAAAAMADIAEVIVLHREFPGWAVWLPHGGRPWIAVRPASGRAAGPDLPMIWAQAGTAGDLADRMRATDAQLAPR